MCHLRRERDACSRAVHPLAASFPHALSSVLADLETGIGLVWNEARRGTKRNDLEIEEDAAARYGGCGVGSARDRLRWRFEGRRWDGYEGGVVTGEITISGSSTVEPISSAVAGKFSADNPDVNISVEGPGTGDGFALFCEGETDISDASRPIKLDEEEPICKKNGIDYIELKVGIDGLSVITSHDNQDVTCLGFPDLYALLGPESEGFKNWSDANSLGEEVGATHAPSRACSASSKTPLIPPAYRNRRSR
jgi:ABC-type phosphate transport system substrate-binding protein